MRKVIGGASDNCSLCGGTTLFIKIGGEIYSCCKDCGSLTKGKEQIETRIYKFNNKGEIEC